MLVLSGELGSVEVLRFSPDGTEIAAGGRRQYLEVWSLIDTPVHHDYPSLTRVNDIRYDPIRPLLYVVAEDAAILSGRGYLMKSWDWNIQDLSERLAISDDGQTLIVTGRLSMELVGSRTAGYDLGTGPPPKRSWVDSESQSPRLHWGLAWLPGRRQFAVTEWEGEHPNQTAQLVIRDGLTGQTVWAFRRHGLPTDQLDASYDWLVSATGATLTCWSTREFGVEPITVRNISRKHFTALAFHPSGRYLAATSNDATVKLYETATWALARNFTWNIGRLRSIAFSPDGLLAAAGSDTGKIIVWDVDF